MLFLSDVLQIKNKQLYIEVGVCVLFMYLWFIFKLYLVWKYDNSVYTFFLSIVGTARENALYTLLYNVRNQYVQFTQEHFQVGYTNNTSCEQIVIKCAVACRFSSL